MPFSARKVPQEEPALILRDIKQTPPDSITDRHIFVVSDRCNLRIS